VGLAVGSVVLVIAGIIGATWLPFMQITAVDLSGVKTIPKEKVTDFVKNELNGTYGFVIPKKNVFLYPKQSIEAKLLQQFATLADVDVHAQNFHMLVVVATERQPAALWCGDSTASSSSCYLLDKDGIIYAPAVVYSGDAYQRYYGLPAQAGLAKDGPLPRQFMRADTFHSLSGLVDSLAQKTHLASRSITIDEGDDVHLALSGDVTLIFSLGASSADVLNRFGLAMQAAPFQAHQLTDFNYLDLRFGEKLYYKLKTP
jgi:hypothetical protein